MSDDGPKTPPQTPSAMHRLGLHDCPKCRGTRLLCDLCAEGGKVTLDVATKWILEHPEAADTDPAPAPDTEK